MFLYSMKLQLLEKIHGNISQHRQQPIYEPLLGHTSIIIIIDFVGKLLAPAIILLSGSLFLIVKQNYSAVKYY
jgi:hypothetical protein